MQYINVKRLNQYMEIIYFKASLEEKFYSYIKLVIELTWDLIENVYHEL